MKLNELGRPIPGRKLSMQSYFLTYSKLEKKKEKRELLIGFSAEGTLISASAAAHRCPKLDIKQVV